MNILRLLRRVALLSLLPGLSLACACGCGVFDVGTSSMFANHAGGMLFVEYDYLDQNRNWSGTSSAPADANEDKLVHTAFHTLGGHYMFNRHWGMAAEVPYWQRYFRHVDEDTGDLVAVNHGALGDIRLKALYTGFSDDMSTGVSFGVKLPTGETDYAGFDADTQIGTGSTDLLLGFYHMGRVTTDNRWSYFLQGQVASPLAHKASYRPGSELVATGGVYFEGWNYSNGLKLSPIGQVRAMLRRSDGGSQGMPDETGYTRLLFVPGVEVARGDLRVYADVALPVYTNVRGNQLVATTMWKLNVSRSF